MTARSRAHLTLVTSQELPTAASPAPIAVHRLAALVVEAAQVWAAGVFAVPGDREAVPLPLDHPATLALLDAVYTLDAYVTAGPPARAARLILPDR